MTGPAIDARFEGALGGFHLDAAFTVEARGVTAVVGPSGCGKTTLLRCIAGLTRLPGRLMVQGQVWQDHGHFLPPHRRAVGYVFQEPSLFAHLSVRQNLDFGFKRRKRPPAIGFDDVIALLGVGPLLHRSTGRLSGGERQRVAIGRALLSQPDILLMDEPVSSLDADSKADILPYFARLQQTLPIPIVYVSHDLSEVARIADRVLPMRAGRILATAGQGDPSDQAARRTLATLDADQVSRLALAALRAGLAPAAASDDRES